MYKSKKRNVDFVTRYRIDRRRVKQSGGMIDDAAVDAWSHESALHRGCSALAFVPHQPPRSLLEALASHSSLDSIVRYTREDAGEAFHPAHSLVAIPQLDPVPLHHAEAALSHPLQDQLAGPRQLVL